MLSDERMSAAYAQRNARPWVRMVDVMDGLGAAFIFSAVGGMALPKL